MSAVSASRGERVDAHESARGASWRAEREKLNREKLLTSHVPSTGHDTVIDFLCHRALIGDRKWLGAAVVAATGVVYGVPSHARRVLKLQPRSQGAINAIGDDDVLPSTHFKFLRGIDGKNGKVYGLPAWASGVLCVDCATDDVRLIGELPRDVKWQWHGGALGNDGALYAVPCNAQKVLRVDTTNDAVTFIGDLGDDGAMKNKWYGGVKDRNGVIWGIPYCSDKVLKITPETQSVELLDVLDDDGKAMAKNAFQYHGGVLAPDGCIYGFPSHAERVLKIDCATGKTSLIGHSLGDQGYKFGGGCVGGDGNIYAFPSDFRAVLKIDVKTETVSLLGENEPSMLGQLKNKWQNGVLARDGLIYGIPCDAPSVLCIDVARQRVFFLGALGDLPDKYQGGFLDQVDGVIYAIPENAPNIMRIIPAGSTPTPPPLAGAEHVVV